MRVKTLRLPTALQRSPSAFPFKITGVMEENNPNKVGRDEDDKDASALTVVGGKGNLNNGPPSSPLP